MKTLTLPELAQGEIYAGIILNSDGAPSHHLILLAGDNDDANWADQTEWAKSIGGELPTRAEQSLLFANCKPHFQQNWYWSGETVSSEPGWAWGQHFDSGCQSNVLMSYELRARAGRRLPIQSFSNLKGLNHEHRHTRIHQGNAAAFCLADEVSKASDIGNTLLRGTNGSEEPMPDAPRISAVINDALKPCPAEQLSLSHGDESS